MGGLLVVRKGVGGVVSATAHVAANQADPEIRVRPADAALVPRRLFPGQVHPFAEVILGISADRASAASPLLQTRAMKHMLAQDRE